MPMTPESCGLVHYNTPRCANYLRGPDNAVLQDEVPNLVGTKHVGSDFVESADIVNCRWEQAKHRQADPGFPPCLFSQIVTKQRASASSERALFGGVGEDDDAAAEGRRVHKLH
jgi:hypothetical protein